MKLKIVEEVRRRVQKSRLAVRWRSDERFRVNVNLYAALIWNVAYGAFNLWLGFFYGSLWYYSMAAYFILLAVMRFFILRYTRGHRGAENRAAELKRYTAVGVIFLFMNIAVSLMVFFMVCFGRTFYHNDITAITMATYTFTAFAVSVVNLVKYRKYKSPVYTASKIIGLAAASVSMLTLEATMLTTFGADGIDKGTWRALLASTGGVVSLLIIAMAVYMMITGISELRRIKETEKENERQ